MTQHTQIMASVDGNDKWDIREENSEECIAIMDGLNQEANAASIVKAWNCHDELVEALKIARWATSAMAEVMSKAKLFCPETGAIKVIDAAIAKAEQVQS